MAESIAIARAIEVAEHNGWRNGETLIVFDSIRSTPYYGIRLEVEPAAEACGGFTARAYDGVGKYVSVWHPTWTREQVCESALDRYLKILNHGI